MRQVQSRCDHVRGLEFRGAWCGSLSLSLSIYIYIYVVFILCVFFGGGSDLGVLVLRALQQGLRLGLLKFIKGDIEVSSGTVEWCRRYRNSCGTELDNSEMASPVVS